MPTDESSSLEDLLARYVDRLNEGELISKEEILAENPVHGPEIVEHLEGFIEWTIDTDSNEPLGTLGDYTLRREIGRGGMGVVYEAWENSMDRVVALKVLPPGIAADNKAFHRFMREAKTAGQINHQNVVSVYSTGVKEGTPWYSMEYVEGETLAQIIANIRDAEPESKTVFGKKDDTQFFANSAKAFSNVADGLQHAHSKGVTHRDIKPSNLILDQEGRLRILDFGLARLEGQESLSISGDLVGTPLYMSPEQAQQRKIKVDHRTDVYSLGATMYEMLTARPPFRGKDHRDTLSQIIERDPTEPRKVNPRVPKDLETIVLKCLRKDPGDRYGTAEALAQDLRRFVRGDPIEARPQSVWERLLRRAVRNTARLVAAALMVILFTSVAVLLWRNYRLSYDRARAEHERLVLSAVMKTHCGYPSAVTEQNDLLNTDAMGFPVPILIPGELLMMGTGSHPLEEAVDDLRTASGLVEGCPEDHYHLARALLFSQRRPEAVEELKNAIKCDPDFVPARIMLDDLTGKSGDASTRGATEDGESSPWQQLWRVGYQAAKERHWAAAAEAYLQLITYMEREGEPYLGFAIEIYLGRGIALLEAEEFDDAIEALARTCGFFAGRFHFFEPELLLGKAYYMNGEEDRADKRFRSLYGRLNTAAEKKVLAVWIASTYLSLGAYRETLHWVELVPRGSVEERLRAAILMGTHQWNEAATAARHACDRDPEDVCAHLMLGWALWFQLVWGGGIPEREKKFLELDNVIGTLHRLAPQNPSAILLRGLFAPIRGGTSQEAIEACKEAMRRGLDRAHGEYTLGAILYLQGRSKDALPHFKQAIELRPRNALFHFGLALAFSGMERRQESMCEYERAIDLDPGFSWSQRNLGLMYYEDREFKKAAHHLGLSHRLAPKVERRFFWSSALFNIGRFDQAIAVLEEADSFVPKLGRISHDLTALRRLKNESPARTEELMEKALHYTRLALEKTRFQVPALTSTLAEIQFLAERPREAMRTLEDACRDYPGATRYFGPKLEEYRRSVLPDLLTFASVDWALTELDLKRLIDEDRGRALLPYLEGRILQRAGRHRAAVEKFHQAASLASEDPRPFLRLAESLSAVGEKETIETTLREALEGNYAQSRDLWNLWLVAGLEGGRRPYEMLSDFPKINAGIARNKKGKEEAVTGPAESRSNYGDDIRWLLAQLQEGVVRINCGGDDDLATGTEPWGRDRFFVAGNVARHDELNARIALSGPVYGAERWFLSDYGAAYRIPLPKSTYRITLHFAELCFHRAGSRVFDVVVEGATELLEYEPLKKAGEFGRPDTHSFEQDVHDGILDIEFITKRKQPQICGIEIEKMR